MRGGYRLLSLTRRLGMLDRVVRYRIADDMTLDVPISRPENAGARADVFRYQTEMIDDLVATVTSMSGPVTFIDCGADIGLVSVLVAARCPDRVEAILAIEPNEAARRILDVNLRRLPCATRAYGAAVSDFNGRGKLAAPPYDSSDHALYLVPAADGDVDVITVDDLPIPPRRAIVMKLDVEGAEHAALRGAKQTLLGAAEFAVSLEAHPRVTERTGIDPIEVVRFLEGLRPCSVRTSEFPDIRISTAQPFFSQVPDSGLRGLTILCRTLPPDPSPSP
jgi:FkbM family methyltransferase